MSAQDCLVFCEYRGVKENHKAKEVIENEIGRRKTMLDTKKNNSIIETTTSKKIWAMRIRIGRKIALSVLVAVIASSMLSGCGKSNELFVLNHPVYPNGLNVSEVGQLRARENQRRQFGYNETRHNDIDGITGPGIFLITWRFGEGSSRPDLAKRYAIHKSNQQNSNTSNIEIAKVISPIESKD